ncbi:MAG: pyruvate kinase [Bacteriovoracaceae bacterium]|nr:pyruvate kinase [Bacteriovoracaceae bacterium]
MECKVRSFKRNAKIVATMGPSTNNVEIIEELIKAGVNVCRINMSHGTHGEQADRMAMIRKAAKNLGREVGILLDLQGPKIRVDKLPEPLDLKDGSEWVIGETKYQAELPQYKDCYIPTIYDKLVDDCRVGERVLFDDGNYSAEIIDKEEHIVKIRIEAGGLLKSNKGINLPDTNVSVPSFTAKDREDLAFGLTQEIDFIALSFVRRAQDIIDVKEMLKEAGKDYPIISKIEKPQALENIEEILEVTDALMIARGDMAVEVGNHLVPRIQKDLIKRCNELGKPVITATQMLESMIDCPSPTRAEASDVANAIWDGTDAVMLSGETAAGKYPIKTVEMMDKIVEEAEKTPHKLPLLRNVEIDTITGSMMVASSMVAEKIGAKRVLVVTETGYSTLEMMRFKPTVPVLGVTRSVDAMRRMCMYWGIRPFHIPYREDDANIERKVIELAIDECQLEAGDRIVVARGDGRFFKSGSANNIRVEIID